MFVFHAFWDLPILVPKSALSASSPWPLGSYHSPGRERHVIGLMRITVPIKEGLLGSAELNVAATYGISEESIDPIISSS